MFGCRDSPLVNSCLASGSAWSVVVSSVFALSETRLVLEDLPECLVIIIIIRESDCNANTKTVSTPRERLQDKCWPKTG